MLTWTPRWIRGGVLMVVGYPLFDETLREGFETHLNG